MFGRTCVRSLVVSPNKILLV